MSATKPSVTIAVLCGGPSRERGISLNSARSVLDHLSGPSVQVAPFYMDTQCRFYRIAPGMLYSNTPADFDFKIARDYTPLDEQGLVRALRECDAVLPAIHGAYGEDGSMQSLLEAHDIPYVGSSAASCREMFHKYRAAQRMKAAGMPALPALLVKNGADHTAAVQAFFAEHVPLGGRAIVKPVSSGSSIGVTAVETPEEALRCLPEVFACDPNNEAMLEPFCTGTEFSVAVLQNTAGEPVALAPSSVRISYADGGFFDYRKKYLPTEGTRWPCPADVPRDVLERMRGGAEDVFRLFNMRDAVRIDGWVLDNGTVVFTDINPASGMEQNSFLFQQAARAGLSHRETLRLICARFLPDSPEDNADTATGKMPVYVLAGGKTAERQVSLMSGTNVWLKLRPSETYAPELFFLRKDGTVSTLPYGYALRHTVEEIDENCTAAPDIEAVNAPVRADVRARLGLAPADAALPETMTLDAFVAKADTAGAFVFIGLHGGFGEDGRLQAMLDARDIPYNGSGSEASAICMDKARTGEILDDLQDAGLVSCRKRPLSAADMRTVAADLEHARVLYEDISARCGAEFILKPRFDGCSAGVARIDSAAALYVYAQAATGGTKHVPPHTFPGQAAIVEFSGMTDADYLAEEYIETDAISYRDGVLSREKNQGWLELTVAVLEQNNVYAALPPSITVAETRILSLEEKFQGGTGINITPPPAEMMSEDDTRCIMRAVEKAAAAFGIGNYTRIDVFYNTDTKVVCVIEANSLPGLTPSTVIYHQALASAESLAPRAFLEHIIVSALRNRGHV